jgi:hypothetical protein
LEIALDFKGLMDKDELLLGRLFNEFDILESGKITFEEVKMTLARSGRKMEESYFNSLMKIKFERIFKEKYVGTISKTNFF